MKKRNSITLKNYNSDLSIIIEDLLGGLKYKVMVEAYNVRRLNDLQNHKAQITTKYDEGVHVIQIPVFYDKGEFQYDEYLLFHELGHATLCENYCGLHSTVFIDCKDEQCALLFQDIFHCVSDWYCDHFTMKLHPQSVTKEINCFVKDYPLSTLNKYSHIPSLSCCVLMAHIQYEYYSLGMSGLTGAQQCLYDLYKSYDPNNPSEDNFLNFLKDLSCAYGISSKVTLGREKMYPLLMLR